VVWGVPRFVLDWFMTRGEGPTARVHKMIEMVLPELVALTPGVAAITGTTAVEDAVAALVKAGWIRRTRGARRQNGTPEVNRYEFLWSRHWRLAWICQRLLTEHKGRTDAAVRVYERLVDHPQPGTQIAREEAFTWRRHKTWKPSDVLEEPDTKTEDGPSPENVEEHSLLPVAKIDTITDRWTSVPWAITPTETDRDALEAALKNCPAERVENIIGYSGYSIDSTHLTSHNMYANMYL